MYTQRIISRICFTAKGDGSPAWVFPNRFDMQSDIGFWRAKFTPRFDAKFENGLINNALKSGLSFSSSTAGESAQTAP